MDEVTGEWRKLHNEEINGMYAFGKIETNEMGGAHSACRGEE
jgi:hypothetical protein